MMISFLIPDPSRVVFYTTCLVPNGSGISSGAPGEANIITEITRDQPGIRT
jgi:hypothetical protein